MDFGVELNKTPPKETLLCRELLQLREENILDEIAIVMAIGDHIKTEDPLAEEDTKVEDPLTGYPGGGLPGGGYPNGGGRPPDRGLYPDGGPPDGGRGCPGGGYPNGGGRPPARGEYPVEGPLMEEDLLKDKDHQALKDLLDP